MPTEPEPDRGQYAILEALDQGILVVGAAGRIQFANRGLRSLVPPAGPLVGRLPIEVLPIAELQVAVEEAREGRESDTVVAWRSKDLRLTARPLGDQRALVTLRDVTRARQMERARTDFVANVSHELRTPIAVIRGSAETMLLDAETLPRHLRKLTMSISRNATRLGDLFSDLLRLHRIEVRGRELPLVQLALLPILQQAVIAAVDRAAEQNQTFELSCPADAVGWANAEALGTMVANLAQNAVAYTDEGGTVRVIVSQDEANVVVDIQDTGVGIHPKDQVRMFERFYRVDEARSRSAGGTGLGLAIVKHLASASHCEIRVQSTPGQGSTFSLALPRRRPGPTP
jgi:two-component system, OmpR family, phosphate regulon sensor histidine kinase PhoR